MLAVVGIDGPSWFNDEFWVYPSLVFIGLWGVGNAMIIFIAGMNSVPSSLYDASRIDGASEWQLFRHVTFPIITPVIFYNLVIALIGRIMNDPEQLALAHRPLLEAAESRDGARLRKEIDYHITVAWQEVRAVFRERLSQAASTGEGPP